MKSRILQEVEKLAQEDAFKLEEAEKSYGDSWKKRGGVGAFMMLARKWDRIAQQNSMKNTGYDIFKAIKQDNYSETGLLDDIRDLRRYLLLVEAEMFLRREGDHPVKKHLNTQFSPYENEEGMISDSCEWRTDE
jgi:hypothetical protein